MFLINFILFREAKINGKYLWQPYRCLATTDGTPDYSVWGDAGGGGGKVSMYINDDVIKWKHFPRNWPFVRGIHHTKVPVNSPHKSQWRGALMFSLICVWINGWVNNRGAGDLRRHRGHYDVSVMQSVIWGVGLAESFIVCKCLYHRYKLHHPKLISLTSDCIARIVTIWIREAFIVIGSVQVFRSVVPGRLECNFE